MDKTTDNIASTKHPDFLLAFYHGAFGPTIRIDVVTRNDLARLQSVFVKAACSNTGIIHLAKVLHVKVTHLNAFDLRTSCEEDPSRKQIQRVGGTHTEPALCWTRNPAGWQEVAGLVEGMLDYGQPCHQYAGKRGQDDAVVEIAFLERPLNR